MTRGDQTERRGLQIREVDGAFRWGPASPGVDAWVEMESADPEWGGYYFRAEFAHSDGAFLSLSVNRATPQALPLGARRWRDVPISRLEQWARRWIGDYMTEFAAGLPGGQLQGEADWQEDATRDIERSRMLARVASLYIRLFGEDDQWLLTMHEELELSTDTIPGLIGEARKAGILTKTTRGKGGGSLTERGRRLLGSPTFDPAIQKALDDLTEEYLNDQP